WSTCCVGGRGTRRVACSILLLAATHVFSRGGAVPSSQRALTGKVRTDTAAEAQAEATQALSLGVGELGQRASGHGGEQFPLIVLLFWRRAVHSGELHGCGSLVAGPVVRWSQAIHWRWTCELAGVAAV